MDSNIAIEARHASKIYELRSKEKKSDVKFYALKDLNFQVKKGQVVGILGTNGSGKSTMSIILAGICDPDEGEIIVNGTQALIAINTGLNAQLTGLENIELKGALLGLSKKRIEAIKEGVINSNSNLSGIGTQTIFGKRSVFIEESFCGDMPRLQDLELMVRIVKKFKVYCIDEGLVDYYVGEDSISSNPEKLYAACNKMLELHPELENDNPETLNAIVNMLKYELKRDIISGGFNYLKFAGWIAHTQKSVKNLLIYVLTIIKIYPFFVSLFYKDKL